ncbi:hypothetical protein BV511_15035 [Methylorubrum extorquens]|nr:hypothetical protein BV511_15035 [Methylorubrum extorquens]
MTDEMRRQFLAQKTVDILPFKSDSSADKSLYVAEWIFRLEHRGQVALLPQMIEYFFVTVPGQVNNFVAEVQGLMNRENLQTPLQNAIVEVVESQKPIIVHFAGYPARLVPKARFVTISAADLIV